MREEFKKSFIRHSLDSSSMLCVDEKVNAGLEKLNEIITISTEIKENNITLFSEFRNIDRFYGFVQNGKLSEDNLFYDLNVESAAGANKEHLDDLINPNLEEVEQLLADLKKDIENTVTGIRRYNSGEATAEELANLIEKMTLAEDYERLNVDPNAQVTQNPNNENGSTSISVGQPRRATTYSAAKSTAAATAVPTVATSQISQEHKEQLQSTPNTIQNKPLASTTGASTINKNETQAPVSQPVEKNTNTTNKNSSKDSFINDFTNANLNNTNKSSGKNTSTSKISSTGMATSLKDLISNKKDASSLTSDTVKDISDKTAIKTEAGTLVSSINNNKSTLLKPIKTDLLADISTEETTTAGKFVPPIAGLTTAGVAGVGTKLYIDKKNKNDSDEEQEENNFFNFEEEFNTNNEEKAISEPLSKDELLQSLSTSDGFEDNNLEQ